MQMQLHRASLPSNGCHTTQNTLPHPIPRRVVPGCNAHRARCPSTAVSFQRDPDQSPAGLADVRPQEHWATMLTTMPNLSSEHWSGRLGEFVLSNADTADVASSGAVLHLWKATHSSSSGAGDESLAWQQDAAAQGGNTHTLDTSAGEADEVAVRYFTAEGLSVTHQVSADGPAGGPAAAAAAGGVHKAPLGLSPDGSRVVWDQAALKAKPTAFTFSPTSQQLSLTLPAAAPAAKPGAGAKQQQQQQAVPLYRTLRLLPLSSSGVCVLNAALPEQWGPQLRGGNPPGSYWFFEVLLTHPDAADEWQGSTLGVAYDWTSGRLHSHKYLWQKASQPLEEPRDDLSKVHLTPVSPPARDSQLSLQDLVHKLTHTPNLQQNATTYTYSSSSKPRLQRAHSSGPAPAAAVAAALQGLDVVVGRVGPVECYSSSCGAVHAWFTGSSSATAPTQHASASAAAAAVEGGQEGKEGSGRKSEGGQWDRRQQVLWFPQGGCWARVPAQLPSQQQQQQQKEEEGVVGGGLVEFEVGVIYGDGEGAARCVLQFASGGDRRIVTVVNEEWRRAES